MLPMSAYIGNPVLSLQTMLREISFKYTIIPRLIPDGTFGERTLEAVMVFQREFDLPVTGQVDSGTWEVISATFQECRQCLGIPKPCQVFLDPNFSISPGDSSVHLYVVQAMFMGLATILEEVESGLVTGIQDSCTERNTCWLQRLNHAEETGVMDHSSWNTLSRLYTIFVTYAQTPWLTRPELFAQA